MPMFITTSSLHTPRTPAFEVLIPVTWVLLLNFNPLVKSIEPCRQMEIPLVKLAATSLCDISATLQSYV